MAGLVPAIQMHEGSDLRSEWPAVYMMASGQHGTLYIGVTGHLVRRVLQHRNGSLGGFTARYGVKRLVWFETHLNIEAAIQREASLKKYRREWKVNLIERDNPLWDDLFPALVREEGPLAQLGPETQAL